LIADLSSHTRKRRVLFLAYYFPPLGGAGVQRSAKFTRYLPDFGYEPIVVAGPGSQSRTWTPTDATLGSGGMTVHRVPGPEPPPSERWRARAEHWVLAPTPFSRWWVDGAEMAGVRAGRDADLVYASMSPFESGAAAARIASRLHVPWVADLRDPWALDEVFVYPTALHRRLEQRRMRQTLASAAAVVMNTPEASRQLRLHFPELSDRPIVTIPNGFDAADFTGTLRPRADKSFRIVHAGYVHTPDEGDLRRQRLRRVLGGSFNGYDLFTRSHVYLLRAIEQLLAQDPALEQMVEVHLVGLLSERDREVIRTDVVRTHGYLPHDQSVALLRSADLLFLPMHNLPSGRRARIIPGKTYEYLAAGRPILAAVPDGDIRDLLKAVGTATLCRPDDVDGMVAAILNAIQRRTASESTPEPKPDVLNRYERRSLASELAAVFDQVVGRGTAQVRLELASAQSEGSP
jgi:glycosyltransferase involved in cell wall biosynthesis